MFGLEKKGKPLFEFDLEKELKQDPAKAKALIKSIEEHIADLKNVLRQGSDSKDFDQYGIILHGYAALQKVVGKVAQKK